MCVEFGSFQFNQWDEFDPQHGPGGEHPSAYEIQGQCNIWTPTGQSLAAAHLCGKGWSGRGVFLLDFNWGGHWHELHFWRTCETMLKKEGKKSIDGNYKHSPQSCLCFALAGKDHLKRTCSSALQERLCPSADQCSQCEDQLHGFESPQRERWGSATVLERRTRRLVFSVLGLRVTLRTRPCSPSSAALSFKRGSSEEGQLW